MALADCDRAEHKEWLRAHLEKLEQDWWDGTIDDQGFAEEAGNVIMDYCVGGLAKPPTV